MKKKVAAVLLIAVFMLTAAGCMYKTVNDGAEDMAQGGNAAGPDIIPMNIRELSVPFQDVFDQEGVAINDKVVCYSHGDTVVIAEERCDESEFSRPVEGDERYWWTKGIYVMDVTDNTSSVFSVNKPEAVECAVPYKDGILYTTNVLNDPETDSISYDWQLIYNDGSEETIVDSNINYGSGPKPYLTLIDGTPVYVFTASTQTYSDATFVMKLSGMEPEKVDERVGLIADTIGMATDGKHIAFQLFPNTEEDYTAVVSVYSTDRLVMEIENRTTDYEQIGINDNMLFRISASESDPQLASVGVTDINTGEVLFTIDGDKALYFPVRLNDTLTAVYGSDNRIYAIDSETESLRICETPSSVFGGTTVMQTMGDERILFQQGRGKFYVMSVNGQ